MLCIIELHVLCTLIVICPIYRDDHSQNTVPHWVLITASNDTLVEKGELRGGMCVPGGFAEEPFDERAEIPPEQAHQLTHHLHPCKQFWLSKKFIIVYVHWAEKRFLYACQKTCITTEVKTGHSPPLSLGTVLSN
jgi:hypothetical protein